VLKPGRQRVVRLLQQLVRREGARVVERRVRLAAVEGDGLVEVELGCVVVADEEVCGSKESQRWSWHVHVAFTAST
jgi:hypothetical protein